MASPFNMSPWPGVKEPLPFPAPAAVEPEPKNVTDSEVILTRLREQIATGTQDPDVLLGAIAIAAQAMTDATGAALGIRRDGTVACVGRSGETAPALGARLSEDSGISGECLRCGRSQRCDDTENDPRVDAEVCRHLGLRSIAAVPIRSRLETVGILEVFSTSPQVFTEEHLTQLASLAELADAVSSPKTTRVSVQTEANASPAFEPISRPDLPILTSPWEHSEKSHLPIWRYLAGAGAALVLGLFLFASWRMWSELKSRNNNTRSVVVQPSATTPVNAALTSTTSDLPAKPTAEQIAATQPVTKNPQKSLGVIPASNIDSEPDDGLIRSIPIDSSTPAKTEGSTSSNKPAEADPSASAPPQVSMVSTNQDSLRGILAPASSLPQLADIPHSEGVIPMVLERQIMPNYPHQALMMRREGAVVMRATVSDTGKVSQVKLLSGDPILGQSAMDAVRQWRYRPAKLNGQPTQAETDITLNFKLP